MKDKKLNNNYNLENSAMLEKSIKDLNKYNDICYGGHNFQTTYDIGASVESNTYLSIVFKVTNFLYNIMSYSI
jgi:hypothetical protein